MNRIARSLPLLAGALLVWAAIAEPVVAAEDVTRQEIQALIDGLGDSDGQANQPERESLLNFYREALQHIDTAERRAAAGEAFRQAMVDAPAQVKDLGDRSAALAAEPPPDGAGLGRLRDERLQQRLADTRTRIAEQADKVAERSQLLNELRQRPARSHEAQRLVRSRLAEIDTELRRLADASGPLAEARRLTLRAERTALNAEGSKLDLERLSHDARLEVATLQLSLAQARLERIEAEEQLLQDELDRRQQREVEQVVRETTSVQQDLAQMPALVRQAAEENARLSTLLVELGEQDQIARARLKSLRTRRNQIDRNYQRALLQVEFSALDESLGQMLRGQRNQLPAAKQLAKEKLALEVELADARLAQFRLQGGLEDLASIDAAVERQIETATDAGGKALTGNELLLARQLLPKLLTDRKPLLEKLQDAYSEHAKLLETLLLTQQQFNDLVGSYRELLDENLLWIANTPPIDAGWLARFPASLVSLLAPEPWAGAMIEIRSLLGERPLSTVTVVVLTIALLLLRRQMRATLERLAADVGNVRRDSFAHTLQALVITALLAAPWPLLMRYVGWLILSADTGNTTQAIGQALWHGADAFFTLGFLLALYFPYGLAERHFQWHPHARQVLRTNLAWLLPTLVTLAMVALYCEQRGVADNRLQETVGRLAFMAQAAALSLFAWRVLHPGRGVFGDILQQQFHGWRWRMRYLWFPVTVGLPWVLIVIAAQGYYFAGLRMEGLVYRSIIAIAVGFLLYVLTTRWLLVAERRLAFVRARAKRRAELEARKSRDAGAESGDAQPEKLEMPEIGLDAISAQTRRLLRVIISLLVLVVIWHVWSDVAPALGVLDEVTLWQQQLEGAKGTVLVPITLASLLLALLVIGLTVLSARNVSGVLEITLPSHLSAGNRYAATTMIRYLIYAIGIVAGFNLLGIGWDQLQWLVAAIGVGLGFGLKEIFANFFSGLIILLERPIRLGDLVTVDDISGTVSRIRMRATTITDWDNRELIIPNQNLVIQPVINWTLTDPITRVMFSVGIAYDSDTELAHRVMMETIQANPLVLSEPAPTVFFAGFGDSALTFEIRVFVRDRVQRLVVIHELHMALARALREQGIEMPFPQRDLHLRSVEPGIRLDGTPSDDQ